MSEALEASRGGWLGVELRHLAAPVAIQEAGAFRGAAKRLGYVQSAVSRQIAFLERLVGRQLIERSRGRGDVVLTDAGVRLAYHARAILARLDAACTDMDCAATSKSRAAVRVGVDRLTADWLLPDVIGRLRVRCWPVDVVPVEVEMSEQRCGLLERGALDAAFVEEADALLL
jgi:DNA-binding transcriptional LysR family regulator